MLFRSHEGQRVISARLGLPYSTLRCGEWSLAPEVQVELAIEGERLRQAAARFATLARKVIAYQETDPD
jgi:hypothetical protein